MPEIQISDEELVSALTKLIIKRWKLVLFVLVFFASLFFGGGWYVYQDAKLRTQTLMISLYEDVTTAKEKAQELTDEAEFASEEAQRDIELIRKKLSRAQQVLDENIGILNKTIEETYEQQQMIQREQQIQQQPAPQVKKPRLKKY